MATSSSTAHITAGTVLGITYADRAILAVESRITTYEDAEVQPYNFVKFIKPFDNLYIYLGMTDDYGDCMSDIHQFLEQELRDHANRARQGAEPTDMQMAVNDVKACLNKLHKQIWSRDDKRVGILMVGAVDVAEPFRIYSIDRPFGGNRYEYELVNDFKECIGTGSLAIPNYVFRCSQDFSEKEAASYALHGVRLAIKKDWRSGGSINVIRIRRNSSIEDRYDPADPNDPTSEYSRVPEARKRL